MSDHKTATAAWEDAAAAPRSASQARTSFNVATRVPQRNWAAERNRLNDKVRWDLSTAERAVLDAIEVHIGDHAEGWPTQKRIALQTGLSDRQVRRIVEKLVVAGFLIVSVAALSGGLPRAYRTRGQRLVYRRGPRLSVPAAARTWVPRVCGHDDGTSRPGGQGDRGSEPIVGHDVRASADMVSDKRSEIEKLRNSPKAPAADSGGPAGVLRALDALTRDMERR
jgi:hypothetical protein